MPISSFYGLQTSLRGLLAQQRLLDTTGHNIANASTQGYSRQEAALVASPALEIPAGGIAGGAGAHLGSGVDVQAFRRIRDQFIDLQYRGQNTNLGDWKARAAALQQAVVEKGAALADAFGTVRDQISLVQSQSYAQYADLARPASAGDPGGEVAQIAKEVADLNDSIKRFVTSGDIP